MRRTTTPRTRRARPDAAISTLRGRMANGIGLVIRRAERHHPDLARLAAIRPFSRTSS